jgi:hypothetical protein
VSLSKQRRQRHGGKRFYHRNCKVMAIGGDAATMAFVDLWRGILLCDVLTVEREAVRRRRRVPLAGEPMPLLRYVTVPEPMLSNETLEGDARLYRDVAVVGGRLKYVELQLHWKACSGDCYFSDGWMASTWSRPINCS